MLTKKDKAWIRETIEELIRKHEAQRMKLKLNSMYGTIITDKAWKDFYKNGATYADTDSIKVKDVSRETFSCTQEELEVFEEITKAINNECGQVSCEECIFRAKVRRFNSNCLVNQLNAVRRHHS